MRQRCGTVALLASLLMAPEAAAAERTLALEVVLNGRSTGRVGEIIERDGALYARPAELAVLGFALPPGLAVPSPSLVAGSELIPLSLLPNVRVQVNEVKQTLVIEASDTALLPTELGGGSAVRLAPLSASGYGALLNYDVLGTFSGQQKTGGALLDARGFSPYGVLESTGLANITPLPGQQSFVRLDTTYTYSEPEDLRRWRAGDVVTGALAWSRAVRLGGGQLSSDFSLRPDLVTYPLPVISASAAVPSTVNVLVNGIRQFSEPVQPGPFAVRSLPVVTGAGEVSVAVLDALGRQVLVTLPFYASTTLLKPGLASYSLEAGMARQDYSLITDGYAHWATNGALRYGLTDWLTMEGHIEGTDSLVLLGAGAAAEVGTFGIVNAAVSCSASRAGLAADTASRAHGSTGGGLVSAGFQRVSRSLSFNLSGTWATDSYRDIAAANGSPVPQSTLNASIGYQLGSWGNLGVAYIKQISRVQPQSPANTQQETFGLITKPQVELVTASYSIPVSDFAAFYATAFKDLRDSKTYGVGIGLSFALGGSTSASAGSALDNGRATQSVAIGKSALTTNDYGYQVEDSEGAAARRLAAGEFLSPWGRVTAGVDQSPGQLSERAGARGAVVLAGGNLFASDTITDSFAVVHTGDVGGVPVLYENRPVGTTDASGTLLVPSLLSYQNNRLAVDVTALPPDVEAGQSSAELRPPDRSGIVVDFHIRKVHAALLKLQDSKGQPIPLGAVARLPGEEDQPVGYEGEAYVTGLKPTNRMEVVLPNGTACAVQFTYKPVAGDIPVIGPLRCQ
jgi:outer membrane usher protein